MKSFFAFLAILALCIWSPKAAVILCLLGALLALLVLLVLMCTPRR